MVHGNKRPTLKDIALAAGVSKSTVSLVLHDSLKVSPETRAKVYRILKEYNYLPNANAKSLAKGKTWTIGLVTKFFRHEYIEYSYFGEILGGILDVLDRMGYNLMLYNLDTPFNLTVDGLILISIDTYSPFSEKVHKLNIPTIFVNRQSPDVNYVTTDFFGGCITGINYLLDLGHKQIGFISGPLDHSPAIDRLNGYKMALISKGIQINDKLIFISSSYGDTAGYLAAES
ncbi:LacI family DNA-binding transcriptional regulator, partial [bacterium]|nr:LacI family DNA-binding transcriptional regulator [bacterium]